MMAVLTIRRLEKGGLPARVAWFNQEDAHLHMPLDVPFSLAETEAWFSTTLLNDTRRDFVAVADGDDGESIAAMFGLVNIDVRNRRAELYILVNPMMRGQGIGRACVRWLCHYGFGCLGLNKIYLFTLSENTEAQRFYEHLHFKLEGILREHLYYKGSMTDRCIYGLLANECYRLPWYDSGPLKFKIEVASRSE